MKISVSLLLLLFWAQTSLCQEKEQKRLLCQMVDSDGKEPIKVDSAGEGGLKITPFSFSGATSFLQSALPFLKDLPVVDSPTDLEPLPIQTTTKNVSVTCDVVSDGVKKQIKDLEDKVAKLTELVDKMNEDAVCPGGFTYLSRCFRLMEIRGKTFSHQKAEDLCNFNGGVLAQLDSSLVFTRVATYVHDKFASAKYGNKTILAAWTGITYEIATAVGATQGPFHVPITSNETTERLNALNKHLVWFPGFPKQIISYDKVALQFRFAGRLRQRVINVGAINTSKRRRHVPLCQFEMKDWQKLDSVSARLFRFNF